MENSSENIEPTMGSYVSHSKTDESPLSSKKINDDDSSGNLEPFSTLHKYTKSSTSSIVSPNNPSEIRVKVNIESSANDSNIVYKMMPINDKYRTKDVKRLILEKFFMNPETCDIYQLVQILDPQNYTSSFTSDSTLFQPSHEPSKELVINDNCNVFYAAKNMNEMLFVLRKKDGEGGATSGGFTSSSSSLGHQQQQHGSPTTGTRMNRINSAFASQGGANYQRSNGSARNIYDQLPPHAPSSFNKAKSGSVSGTSNSNGSESGSSSKNWKFFKKILS
jgi:hypothetical protein